MRATGAKLGAFCTEFRSGSNGIGPGPQKNCNTNTKIEEYIEKLPIFRPGGQILQTCFFWLGFRLNVHKVGRLTAGRSPAGQSRPAEGWLVAGRGRQTHIKRIDFTSMRGIPGSRDPGIPAHGRPISGWPVPAGRRLASCRQGQANSYKTHRFH